MDWSRFEAWISATPLLALGGCALTLMTLSLFLGVTLRARHSRRPQDPDADRQEGYIVSAVLGLLALLLGFTFALAVDRFDIRRGLVVAEANTIATAYLRTQLLGDPHRTRISALLVRYVDNRIDLATAEQPRAGALLKTNDQILTDLWAATASAFDDIKQLDFSSGYLEAMNNMINLDSSRKAARLAHVPGVIYAVLMIYLVVTAGVLGYGLTGVRGRVATAIMLVLLAMSLTLIVDIDRPVRGGIRESQAPMERLRDRLATQPSRTFDRWRTR